MGPARPLHISCLFITSYCLEVIKITNVSSLRNSLRVVFILIGCIGFIAVHSQQFTTEHFERGIDHSFNHSNFIGGGAAFFDADNDGDDDLYITSGLSIDHLYINDGSGNFTYDSFNSGVAITKDINTMGVIAGDIDNDGFKDLFVTTYGDRTSEFVKNILFHNQGDGTFIDVWSSSFDFNHTWSVSASFIDYNQDGFLDIYTADYVKENNLIRDENNKIIEYAHDCFSNRLFRNDGNLGFREVSSILKTNDKGCGLSVAVSDVNNDGHMDILTANDFGEFTGANQAFVYNAEKKKFENLSDSLNLGIPMYGMGIAVGDYDQNGSLDYYFSNLGNNYLMSSSGNKYEDVALETGTDNTINIESDPDFAVSWGNSFLDVDNDMDLDLFVANGYIPSPDFIPTNIRDRDQLFINNGSFGFEERSSEVGINNSFVSRGMAYSDIDNDGDLDILSIVQKIPKNDFTRVTQLFVNQSTENNWLKLKLVGVNENISRDAFGSKVWVHTDGTVQLREADGGSGHCSHNSSLLHFGLGSNEFIDSIQIKWLGYDGLQTVYDIEKNSLLTIEQDSTLQITTPTKEITKSDFKIFPNPTRGRLFFSSGLQGASYYLIDQFGNISQLTKDGNELHFSNFNNLADGIYYIKQVNRESTAVAKFILIKE